MNKLANLLSLFPLVFQNGQTKINFKTLEPAAADGHAVDADGQRVDPEGRNAGENVLNNILSVMDGQIFVLSAGIFRLEWKNQPITNIKTFITLV